MAFSFPHENDYMQLRKFFKKEGYSDKGILETIGFKSIPSINEHDLPLLIERTKQETPLNMLIRLFLLNIPVSIEFARKAFEPLYLETLAEAKIIRLNETDVIAQLKLLPYKDRFIAFDLPQILLSENKQNYVMGIGSSTITLSNLTIRKQSRNTLDLGTGCGVHAFLAAAHSDKVFATDLNPRAVQMAEFNARLNGLSNVTCVGGNLFEPVHGQQFDLVVSNPPFVISPESRYIYRDGGMDGDEICQKIIRQVPQFLYEGGFCQILCNWAEKKGLDWKDRLRVWFESTGCDVWVLRSEFRDAATYATTWIRHTEKDNSDQSFPQRFKTWMAYYEKLGIESFGAGLITMRKSINQPNWFYADDSPDKMLGPCGDDIVKRFERYDFLETVKEDASLLEAVLQYTPDIRLDQQMKPSENGWAVSTSTISLIKGFAYQGNADTVIANLIINCNGGTPLKDVITAMTESLGIETEKVMPAICQVVRKLIEQGFLLPGKP